MHAPVRPSYADATATYRPFVDGLRAVSILAVVPYHTGIPGFSGGFVGVDVFFVISGYLIIGQIVAAHDAGRFAFGDFWARRAWRILPPFMLVLLFTIVVAPLLLILPDELRDFGKQAANAATMTINHLFLARQGYFDDTSETSVLLHFWSLAVEEQFYLVAPLLIAGIWAASRRLGGGVPPGRALAVAAVALFVLSFAGSIAWSVPPGGRNPGFYLAPLRAWEFIAGGAVPILAAHARRLGGPGLAGLAALGLAAIVAAAVGLSAHDAYPGWLAMLPVAGATAVIVAGVAGANGPAIRLLSSPPMVAIGLVSYSWYLWHWPLLAFAEIRLFGEMELFVGLALSTLALGLAAATYILVERPIRQMRQSGRIGLGWRPVVVGICACVVVGVASRQGMDALGDRAEAFVPAVYRAVARGAAPVCDFRTVPDGKACVEQAAGRATTIALGDSLVMVPRDAIVAAVSERGGFLLSAASPACIAITHADIFLYDLTMQIDCAALHARIPGLLKGMGIAHPRSAILHSAWQTYVAEGNNIALGAPGSGLPAPDQDEAFRDGLRATVFDLMSSGVERILVIGPTPVFSRAAPNCLALADHVGVDRTRTCGRPRADVEEQSGKAAALIEAAIGDIENVRQISPIDQFCDAEWCRPWAGDSVLYVNRFHLADAGMERIIAAHAADFDWLLGRPLADSLMQAASP